MPEIPFLHDIVVLFGAALVVLVLSHRLRLPSIAGFLITGMVVGPSGLGWIADPHHVEVFAELGVVFLLFGIGLELSVDRLIELRRLLLLGGGLQVVLTILATSAVALLLGARSGLALYLGSVVALSSTVIVFKLLSERRELEAPHGQVATGILLFQDFLIVPLLLVVPLLAGAATPSGGAFLVRFGGGILIVVAAFAV
ncbi:MAG: cation:proton antiporter, partial [Acidobacteria bacterium]|nr:cation:proton antiporter [Acidobacteriota bacterium]